MSKQQDNLAAAINDSSIGLSKPLCRELIKQMSGEHHFIEYFSNDCAVANSETWGFSGIQAIFFYHENKADLLFFMAQHARKKGFSSGFDYIDKEMSAHFYNRDATAAALHEPKSNYPSAEHALITGIIVQLAINTLADRYKALNQTTKVTSKN